MNRVLNILVSRLIGAALSHRNFKSLGVLLVLVLAGLGLASLLTPARTMPAPVPGTAHGAQFQLHGRVVHIADGDTFTLLVDGAQQRIRMASIDAPETTKSRERPGQPMGQASKDALSKLIAGKTLTLPCFEQDRYGRNVCDVPLGDGLTANRQQVAAGMAWANMEGRGKFMRDAALPQLEQEARRAKAGLWQSPDPVKPWVWRYQCWKQAQC